MSKYNDLIRGLRILDEFDIDGEDKVRIAGDEIRSSTVVGVHATARMLKLGWTIDEASKEWVFKCPA